VPSATSASLCGRRKGPEVGGQKGKEETNGYTPYRKVAPAEPDPMEEIPEALPEEEAEEEGEDEVLEALPPELRDGVKQYLTAIGRYPLLTPEEEIALARKVREGQEAAERLSQMTGLEAELILRVARSRVLEEPVAPGLPVPSAEERERVEALCRATREARHLYLLVREGEAARRDFVLANLRLVVSVAKRIARKRNLDLLDVIAEGNRGLLRATETFDERLGYRFSTYATHWIRQHAGRYAQQAVRLIRLPVHQEEALGKLERVRVRLSQELGRHPSLEEVAEEMGDGWTPEALEGLLESAREVYRLEEPVFPGDGEPGNPYGDFLESPLPGPEETALAQARREAILKVLEGLPPREAEVIRLRYGLDGFPPLTLEEVARKLRVTRERVRQLERKALTRLKLDRFRKRLEGLND
jgi:RNA polymerase primary sigma factor